MGRSRRVTLRCASEDLPSGWMAPADLVNVQALRQLAQQAVAGDASDSAVGKQLRLLPTLSQLGHPLIHAFDAQFGGEDDKGALRETISAATDRQWFKQKHSARWRGAAVVLEEDGVETAWLGAAGYHRAGSPEDFYEEFARRCSSGSEGFLPTSEDLKVRTVEIKVMRLDAWKLQLHLTALALLDTALNDPENVYNTAVLSPDSTELLTLTMVIVQTDVDGTTTNELIVDLVPVDWTSPALCEKAAIIVKTAIEPQFEEWKSVPLQGNSESHSTVLTEEAMATAHAAAASGTLTANSRPGEVRLGTIAHYTRRAGITFATIHGEAVQAMCGHWFVPMADHEHKPRCTTCQNQYAKTPA